MKLWSGSRFLLLNLILKEVYMCCAKLYSQVGPEGLPQKELMAKCGVSGKVRLSHGLIWARQMLFEL